MGLQFTRFQPSMTQEDLFEAGLGEALNGTLKEVLAGRKSKITVIEPVSIEVSGVAIAFDEEVSFSFYRYQSLQSPVYTLPILPRLERYHSYCEQNMPLLNNESIAAIERTLRLRALHDFMQDMLPAVYHMPLIRLSVFDIFTDADECCSLGSILEKDLERYYLQVADYINNELEHINKVFQSAY